MEQPFFKSYAGELKEVAKEMRAKADNLSPRNEVHPAPTIRDWASRVARVARCLEKSSTDWQ
jgi:hypothetical protein